jgi:hypothetical protein
VNELIAELIAEQPLTVKLVNGFGREIFGAGYSRVTLLGKAKNGEVDFGEAVFNFTEEGEKVEEAVCMIRSRELEPIKFDKPFKIGGKGDKITLPIKMRTA